MKISLTKKIENKQKKKAESRYWRYKNKIHLAKYEVKRYKKRKHKVLEYNKKFKAKSGTVIRKGYIYIACNHPDSDIKGQILLHRLIMENKIGRRLLSSEIVHHIDENRLNNHPDNLELFDSINIHSAKHYTVRKKDSRNRFMAGVT